MTSDRIERYEVLVYWQLIVSITKLEENIVDKAERVDEGNEAKPVKCKTMFTKENSACAKNNLKEKGNPLRKDFVDNMHQSVSNSLFVIPLTITTEPLLKQPVSSNSSMSNRIY